MIEVSFSSAFIRSFKRSIGKDPARRERFQNALETTIQDPFTESLRTHKLADKLNGRWSFTVEYDARVIFRFAEKGRAVFEAIGTHNLVY
ncbi:hypothetical protein BH10ACI2_BH10ACI2_22550 [soil metagenome]